MSTIRINQENMLEWAGCYWEQNIWIKKESQRIESYESTECLLGVSIDYGVRKCVGWYGSMKKELLKRGHNRKGLMSNAAFC